MSVWTKPLGATGVMIPELGMGTWKFQAGADVLRVGLDAGALFIDTAESYGSEGVVAEAIKGRRENVFVATKVSPAHFRRADVLRAADASLSKLGIDHIDLYQLHEPNFSIPIEETMSAMEELVDAGKVRFIGVSNFNVSQLRKAQAALRKHRITANQVRFNLADRTIERELLPFCRAHSITIIAYSPLCRGLTFIRDADPSGALDEMARATGRPAAQVAINWCLCREGVLAIPKGNTAAHVRENCGASGWRLEPEQVQLLDQRVRWHRRSGLEVWLRRLLSPSVKQTMQNAVKCLPGGLRRKFS